MPSLVDFLQVFGIVIDNRSEFSFQMEVVTQMLQTIGGLNKIWWRLEDKLVLI